MSCTIFIETSEDILIAKFISDSDMTIGTSSLAPEDDITLFRGHSWFVCKSYPRVIKRSSCIPGVYSRSSKGSDRKSHFRAIVTCRIDTLNSISSVEVYFLSVVTRSIFTMEHYLVMLWHGTATNFSSIFGGQHTISGIIEGHIGIFSITS